ncbi:hypothetical protein HDV57DRAFT_366884 [Trichoderma longibrachiatum]
MEWVPKPLRFAHFPVMSMQPNQVSAGLDGPTVTAAGTASGPSLESINGVRFFDPATPAMSQMPIQMSMPTPMPSIPSTPSMHQMQPMQSMAMNMPMNMSTRMDTNMGMSVVPKLNLNSGTSVNQNPSMTLSMPPPPILYRPVAGGHQHITTNQRTTNQPQQHAPGSGIITKPHEQADSIRTTVLAPQHNSRVAKRLPSMYSAKARALLRAMVPEAWAQTPIRAQAPVGLAPTDAPEAIIVDDAPPPVPGPIPQTAPAEPNLEDTPAAKAIPPKIDQERLDKLLVCRHWTRHHMISLCQQVEIMVRNRGNDHTTWYHRLMKRRETRGLWNVYEIDGFLYEVDFNKGEAKGIPRREYVKMVDKVKRKCCAPVVEEVDEEEDEEEETEEESEDDEGGSKVEEGEEGKEEGKEESGDEKVHGHKEDGAEVVEDQTREAEEEGDDDAEDGVKEVEEEVEQGGEDVEEMEAVEQPSQALAGGTRSFLDLLDENGDVLPLEAWDQELRNGLAI